MYSEATNAKPNSSPDAPKLRSTNRSIVCMHYSKVRWPWWRDWKQLRRGMFIARHWLQYATNHALSWAECRNWSGVTGETSSE